MSRRMLLEDDYSENGLMPVMDGLVCWLDGRDGKPGDTVWKDRSGNGNNATLTGFSVDGINGFVDGIMRMDKNAKILLPTPLNFTTFQCVFKEDGTNAQIDIIGTNPRTFRYCLRAGDLYPYHVNIKDMATNDNKSIIEQNNEGDSISITNYVIKYLRPLKNEFKFLHLECSFGSHINTTIGCDTNSGAKTEFSTVLIYNKPLSKQERLHNYEYIKSIERGE